MKQQNATQQVSTSKRNLEIPGKHTYHVHTFILPPLGCNLRGC